MSVGKRLDWFEERVYNNANTTIEKMEMVHGFLEGILLRNVWNECWRFNKKTKSNSCDDSYWLQVEKEILDFLKSSSDEDKNRLQR